MNEELRYVVRTWLVDSYRLYDNEISSFIGGLGSKEEMQARADKLNHPQADETAALRRRIAELEETQTVLLESLDTATKLADIRRKHIETLEAENATLKAGLEALTPPTTIGIAAEAKAMQKQVTIKINGETVGQLDVINALQFTQDILALNDEAEEEVTLTADEIEWLAKREIQSMPHRGKFLEAFDGTIRSYPNIDLFRAMTNELLPPIGDSVYDRLYTLKTEFDTSANRAAIEARRNELGKD